MKRTTLLSISLIATLGLAVPVAAQQRMMDGYDGMQRGGMMGGYDGMMGGGMMGGMMGGQNSYAIRTFDADKDGTLTPEEMTTGMQGEMKTHDADTSGSLSLAEFEAMHTARTKTMMVRAFQMHDEDGDGQVTEAEMATMGTMMQRMMAGPDARGVGNDGIGDDN